MKLFPWHNLHVLQLIVFQKIAYPLTHLFTEDILKLHTHALPYLSLDDIFFKQKFRAETM